MACRHCGSRKMGMTVEGRRICSECYKPKAFYENNGYVSEKLVGVIGDKVRRQKDEEINGHRRVGQFTEDLTDANIDDEISQLFGPKVTESELVSVVSGAVYAA